MTDPAFAGARSHHPALGTVIRCGWGNLLRRGESIRCTCTFYSASDPDIIAEQLAIAQWAKRRVRVPKIHRHDFGARVTQYLCPSHARHVARLREDKAARRETSTAPATATEAIAP